eukprot:128073-Chlamydomonas_euryale.AAC.1
MSRILVLLRSPAFQACYALRHPSCLHHAASTPTAPSPPQIDDPASSFAIHGLSGLWGMIFVGLLGRQEYILEAYGHAGREANTATMGLFYGGHGQLLLCQFISVLCNVAWPVRRSMGRKAGGGRRKGGARDQLLLCQFVPVLCNVAWPVRREIGRRRARRGEGTPRAPPTQLAHSFNTYFL